MRAELAALKYCAVLFLSRADANLSWYYYTRPGSGDIDLPRVNFIADGVLNLICLKVCRRKKAHVIDMKIIQLLQCTFVHCTLCTLYTVQCTCTVYNVHSTRVNIYIITRFELIIISVFE